MFFFWRLQRIFLRIYWLSYTDLYVYSARNRAGRHRCPKGKLLCSAAVNTVQVIMTEYLSFVFIYFFLIVNMCQFKRFDFIFSKIYKLNTELNEYIFMNLYCLILLAKLVVTCCSLSVWKDFFLNSWITSQFWLFTVCSSAQFPAVELDHVDRFIIVSGPFWGVRVPVT